MSRALLPAELRRRGILSSLTELNCRPSPYHGDALPTELRERVIRRIRLFIMPGLRSLENLKFVLRVGRLSAEPSIVWIDRVHSVSPEGPSILDLHERLTVIASADSSRRLRPFQEVQAALQVAPSTIVEVQTEYGDHITAQRGANGSQVLFDTKTKLSINADDPSVGLASQLNEQHLMGSHMSLFRVSAERLRERTRTDAELIALARTPLDQLFDLAATITESEARLSDARTRRSDLTERIGEREEREQTISNHIEVSNESKRKIHFLTLALFAVIAVGIAAAVLVTPLVGGAILIGAALLSAVGFIVSKRLGGDDFTDEAADIQLGRVDELFDTHKLTRNRRAAEESLAESVAQWRAIAGNTKPSALLTDRTRIEELAGLLRLIENEDVDPADTDVLVGFASLMAELNRRFPAERVPLLMEDLFSQVAPQYHGVLRTLILRASHRRQVILETGDLDAAKWAAVEAVGGTALLISDFDIDVEPIINQAVAAEQR